MLGHFLIQVFLYFWINNLKITILIIRVRYHHSYGPFMSVLCSNFCHLNFFLIHCNFFWISLGVLFFHCPIISLNLVFFSFLSFPFSTCDINVIALDFSFHELFIVVMSILSKVDNLNNPGGWGQEAIQLCTLAQRCLLLLGFSYY